MGKHCSDKFIGYDHNFILDADMDKEIFGKTLRPASVAVGKDLIMRTYTDQDGVQLYMGNFMGKPGSPNFRGGIPQIPHGAFCLETQTEPNCINHGIGFYDKGEKYTHTTVYKIEKK
jgi:galactose mutarotase-like enzyme